MNSSFSIDLNEDQSPDLNHLFSSSSKITEDNNYGSSSSNSVSYPIFNDFPFFHSHLLHPLHHQDKGENIYASHGEKLDHPSTQNESHNKYSLCKKEQREKNSSSTVKWMSSKMRFMRKMMKSDQQNFKFEEHKGQSSSSMELDDNTSKNLPNNTIRVCSDCNTTKTPLWRSGPRGPKSLCNACGIRQRKARRAQESGINGAMTSTKVQNKDSHLPFKKRCKFTAQAKGRSNNNYINNNNKKKKLCFEDLTSIVLSKNNSAFQQVFPQDEKEAAILLMALSYGLVCG